MNEIRIGADAAAADAAEVAVTKHLVVEDPIVRRAEHDDPVTEDEHRRVVQANVVLHGEILHGVARASSNQDASFEAFHRTRLSTRAPVAGDRDARPIGHADAGELTARSSVVVSEHAAPVEVERDVVGTDDDAVTLTGSYVCGERGVLGDCLPAAHSGSGICRSPGAARRLTRLFPWVGSILVALATWSAQGRSLGSSCGAVHGSAERQQGQSSTDADAASKSSHNRTSVSIFGHLPRCGLVELR